MGEKDVADAPAAGNGRFLPQVRGGAGNEHPAAEAAETGSDGTVRAAPARAERTGRKIVIHGVIIGGREGKGNRRGT